MKILWCLVFHRRHHINYEGHTICMVCDVRGGPPVPIERARYALAGGMA